VHNLCHVTDCGAIVCSAVVKVDGNRGRGFRV